jgi:pimeloyl-ACP methyl ester carboxylesterase
VTKGKDHRDVYCQSSDGLRLYARDYGHSGKALTPVLCLPGLTRNSRDFETIAPQLAQSRRVIAADFRGRGRSQYADAETYRPDVELADAIAMLNHLEVDRVALIGTSRGGIVGMLMAALHKDRLAGLLLNDIGPVLEADGLLRIRSYLGVDAGYADWDQVVEGLKRTNRGFESLTQSEWLAFAKRIFISINGRPELDYDPALAQNFSSVEDIESGNIPQLWELFEAIGDLPVSILRGEHSDLLSAATIEEMKTKNPSLDAKTVAARGHAPFLDEPESWGAIQSWLVRVDANEKAGKFTAPQ